MLSQSRFVLIALACIALAACASDEDTSAGKGAPASKEALWVASGTKNAVSELHYSLSDACHVKLKKPDDMITLSLVEATCVRTRVVSAFDAAAGDKYCSHGRDLKQFVSCILQGQFIGRVIGNAGLPALAPEIQWGDTEEAGRLTNKLLGEKIRATCLSPSDATRKECAESEMLGAFEIDRKAIDFCPNAEQRDACIYWAGFAHSIRLKLDRI